MSKNKTQNNIYKSSDMSLVASILATKQAEIQRCDKTAYPYIFELTPKDICLKFEKQYLNDQLMVPARTVANNVRLLKSMTK